MGVMGPPRLLSKARVLVPVFSAFFAVKRSRNSVLRLAFAPEGADEQAHAKPGACAKWAEENRADDHSLNLDGEFYRHSVEIRRECRIEQIDFSQNKSGDGEGFGEVSASHVCLLEQGSQGCRGTRKILLASRLQCYSYDVFLLHGFECISASVDRAYWLGAWRVCVSAHLADD